MACRWRFVGHKLVHYEIAASLLAEMPGCDSLANPQRAANHLCGLNLLQVKLGYWLTDSKNACDLLIRYPVIRGQQGKNLLAQFLQAR